MRGLKLSKKLRVDYMADVAPHVGAWIEISTARKVWEQEKVAPHVGAWIEISTARKV